MALQSSLGAKKAVMLYFLMGISGSSIRARQSVLMIWSTESLTLRSGQLDARVAHEVLLTSLTEKMKQRQKFEVIFTFCLVLIDKAPTAKLAPPYILLKFHQVFHPCLPAHGVHSESSTVRGFARRSHLYQSSTSLLWVSAGESSAACLTGRSNSGSGW